MRYIITISLCSIMFALALLSPLPVFAQNVQPLDAEWNPSYPIVPCGNVTNSNGTLADPCDFPHVVKLIDNLITLFALYIAIPIAALLFAFAGFRYLFSGGDPGKVKSAHDMFRGVVVGFIIILASYLIVDFILDMLITAELRSFIDEHFLD